MDPRSIEDVRAAKRAEEAQAASFRRAFAEARGLGMAEFRWRGGVYHTRTAEEEARA